MDGNNRFISSYVVDPSINSEGEPIGGIKGFLKSLQKVLRDLTPEKSIIVWDGARGSSYRKSINKQYKSGRKPLSLNRNIDFLDQSQKDQNRLWQQIKLIEILNHLPVYQIVIDDLEADDIISLLCKKLPNKQKIIVSADKDFYQLTNSKTIIYRPTQKEFVNTKDVMKQFSIHPNNFALARAILGDASDNLRGVKGVGIKTLNKKFPELLKEDYFSFSDMIEKCEFLSGEKDGLSYRKVLECQDDVEGNYHIMQLYHPRVSFQNNQRVDEFVECLSGIKSFNQIEFLKTMKNVGINENWGILNNVIKRFA